MIATLFIALFVLLFLGTPVFVALGLSAVLALVGFSDLPLMGVAQRLINGVDKFSLLAVPFFIFAANVMKNGGIAKRIMNWAKTMVGAAVWRSRRRSPACSSARSPARLRRRSLRWAA